MSAVPSPLPMARLASLVSNRSLRLILLPTEACNFRCTYCYEDFALGRMSPETIEGVKALLRRRAPGLDELVLSWFGGEPLVARDIVLDISREARELTRHHPGLRYKAGISTNGWQLTPEVFAGLCDVGVRDYQLSLDGPRQVHDSVRVRANGGPTFDRLWANLLAMRDTRADMSVLVRIHYDGRMIDELEPLVESLSREFLPDPRFSFLFKRLEQLGGPKDHLIHVLPEEQLRPRVEALKRKLRGSTQENPGEPYVCYAARPNSLVIRSNGIIGKCTVALNDERNHLGRLKPDGSLELKPERLPPWLRGLESLDLDELACPMQGLPPAPPLTGTS